MSLAASAGYGSLSEEASRMFRVRKTVLKMLHARGYIVPDDQLNMTADGFRGTFG